MKTKAAVLRAVGQPFEITELELDEPKAGEVLIRYVAAGLCHSDEHLRHGDIVPRFPVVGGHEGAGIIEKVGPGVTRLQPGDHVICSFLPVCGHCRWCSTGKSNLCDMGATILDGMLTDGTYRFHDDEGNDYGGMCMLGTFSERSVISENSAVKVDPTSAGQGRADRLRGAHRLGLGRARGGDRAGRHDRDLRHRRDRHQQRAGRGPGRRPQRHRGRPAAQQARGGRGTGRHAQLRDRRGGERARLPADPRGRRGQGDHHRSAWSTRRSSPTR
jgi:hypothetical protein